jgi:hypothetical protein
MSSPCLATAWIRSTLTTSPNRLPSSLAHAAEACYLGHKHQECGLWLCPLATEPSGSVLPTDATEANLGQPENPMSTNSHLGATAYPEDVCMIALQTVCTDAEVSAALTRDDCGGTSLSFSGATARSITAQTLSIATPLVVAWPDLIFSGLPNDTNHCQLPCSS